MYINNLLSLISYSSDCVLENLILDKVVLDRKTRTAFLEFSSKEQLPYREIKLLKEALETAKVQGIEKFEYIFKVESFSKNDVFDYYSYIANYLSRDEIAFLSAVSFSKDYEDETKTLTVNVPSSDSSVIFVKKKIINEF